MIQAERSVLRAFGATLSALLLLAWWTRELSAGWLTLALVAQLAALVYALRGGRRSTPRGIVLTLGLLLAGHGAATALSWQHVRLETDWSSIVARRERDLGLELSARMSRVVERGQDASREAAALAGRVVLTRQRTPEQLSALFEDLHAVRRATQVDAIAIYADAGDLVAWSGQHRGPLPDSVRLWEARAYFEERPLFSYLYFPMAVPGRQEHAIAAVLVETGIIGDAGETGISGVAARTTTRATFRTGGGEDPVWSLVAGADTVAHARLEPLSQREWRERLDRQGRQAVLFLLLCALVALTATWLRWWGADRPVWAGALPLLVLMPVAAFLPWHDALGDGRIFSPGLFALAGPRSISLGRLLAIVLPIALFVAGRRVVARSPRVLVYGVAAGSVLIAVAYPQILALLLESASPTLLQGTSVYWVAFQLAAVLILAVITLPLMPRVDPAFATTFVRRPRLLVAASLAVAVAFAVAVSLRIHPVAHTHTLLAAAWALPFALAAVALAPTAGRAGGLARWLVAGTLATTATLPQLWVANIEARLVAAEEELHTLGTRADPLLDYLLVEFAREARNRHDAGESGVQLLYRTWVVSGLAQEPYPARIVMWSPLDSTAVQLGSAPMPALVADTGFPALLANLRSVRPYTILPFTEHRDLSRLLSVPLPDGSMITVMVPPRRSLDRTSAIAPFLGVIEPGTQLNLVEPGTGVAAATDTVVWEYDGTRWRSEAIVQYPDGRYHAHLTVTIPAMHVRLARGTLLLTLAIGLLTLIWVIGVIARGGTAVPRGDWTGWLGGFRARVTLALFAFFLIPTAVFGWVAYRALAGEVARAAQTIASHAVKQAVLEFSQGNTDLQELAGHAGSDVLRYHSGELFDVSASEARDLGVYNAWMPPEVFQAISSGEELEASETQTLAGHSYVISYRALPASGTLGVPKPLSAGDTAVRQREFAHLVLFATVIGALLSLLLSVMVGRTLAGPIGLLQRASAAVGAGALRVRLPEAGGEFGQLFASFNRMTRRLRRARKREVRSARVLAWGEMARQVAHEIKNPLTPIKLSVQHMRRAYADRHPNFEEILENNVTQVLGEIDRLSEIARAFSRYGAPSLSTGPLVPVNVSAVIRETLMLYRTGDRELEYVEDIDEDLPAACARSNELKEVLLNLVENSRAALDGSGRITIRAYHREDRIEVEVADNGPGIPPNLLPKIFDPHFSTRTSGTGLGLAIVRRLVESWGGSVGAESEHGRGTTLRVRLQTDMPTVSPPGS